MRRAWCVAFIVAMTMAMTGLGAVACNGGGGQAPTPETTPVVATPVVGTAVPGTVVSSTPFPLPTITGNLLESPAKGYSVQFPEGWTADSNALSFGGMTTDIFFATEEIAGVQPNIAVSREEISDALSPETYLETKIRTVQGLGAQNLDVKSGSTVAGREAAIMNYGLTRDNVQVEKREVVFVDDGHGWSIALTIPTGQGATYYPLFDAFLGSFKLLAPA